MRTVLLMQLAVAIGFTAGNVHAGPTTCRAEGLREHPKFSATPHGMAVYSFSGVCVTAGYRELGYRMSATWTPSESNPANANASEIYHFSYLSGAPGSFDAVIGARCDRDPWLNEHAQCTRIGDNASEELRDWWPDLTASRFPYWLGMIPSGQRDALRAEYNRVNGRFDFTKQIDRVSLNPQPLPPRLDPALQTQAIAQQAGTNAGIIIVSGKDANPPPKALGKVKIDPKPIPWESAIAKPVATEARSGAIEAFRGVIATQEPPLKPDPPICTNARSARARNSPAAPGLEAQCRAAGGTL